MLRWAERLEGGGPEGEYHAAVATGNKLYAFGGDRKNTNSHIDVYVFNTVSLRWTKLPPMKPGRGEPHLDVPSVREDHTAVLIDDIVYLWGGYPYGNVLYAFDVDAHRWFKPRVSGTVPKERHDHSACVFGKVMFIHGGYTHWHGRTNDIYKLNTKTMVWTLIKSGGTPPPATECHSATIIGTKMYVFGGKNWDQYYNTIRVFDTETEQWLDTPSPQLLLEGRYSHSAFAYNGELYIFGGRNWKNTFNDVWKFAPETFSWKKVKPKGKRPGSNYRRCCCMVGHRTFLLGGVNRPGDLYVLDFSPSLKTLCKLAVIQYGLEQSGLPHNIRWELAAMTSNSK